VYYPPSGYDGWYRRDGFATMFEDGLLNLESVCENCETKIVILK